MPLKYAVRTLYRQPLFTAGAVITIALGVGLNATMFAFVNAALWRPLTGVTGPEQLAWVSAVWADRGRESGMSVPEYRDYQVGTASAFSGLAAFTTSPLSLGSGGEPARIDGQFVSGNFFDVLGVIPSAGRLLRQDDEQPAAATTAVLSYRLWHERFAAAPEIVGSTIVINGSTATVVGIAAEGFHGPALGEAADLWVPLTRLPELRTRDRSQLTDRRATSLLVIGRLRDGQSVASAHAAARAVASTLQREYPATNDNRAVRVTSAQSGLRPSARGEIVPLAAVVLIVSGVVLLIACANVANLLLARGVSRSHEMSIRAAIGAGRGRLVFELLTESGVLALAGAAAGLLLSLWANALLQALLPADEFRGLNVAVDLRVIAFAAALAALNVCAFGLVPAFAGTRQALAPTLRQTAGAGGGRTRLQSTFVVAQLALSLVLLVGGALSLRAIQKARAIDLGFVVDGVVTASYDLELQNYTPERRRAFRQALRESLETLPGVRSVGLANMPPLSGTMIGTVVSSIDASGSAVEAPAYLNAASAGYFEALRLPIVRGRSFSTADVPGGPQAAVINETLARRLWGAEDPLGRQIRLEDDAFVVVGIARDSKYDEVTEDPRPFMYSSLEQRPQLDRETVLVRVESDPGTLLRLVQEEIRRLDPQLPVFDVRSMSTLLQDRMDKERAISGLLAAFGGLALLLAALGLYGVMAYTVSRRIRELGIRLALGATPASVVRLVSRDGLRLAAVGLVAGTLPSALLAYGLGTVLFGVQIADVAAFVATCACLLVVSSLAAYVPARRAATLDPIAALRVD
jgi:predicted permease